MAEIPSPLTQSLPANSGNKLLWPIIIVAMVVVLGMGGYFMLSSKIVNLPMGIKGREVKQAYIDYDLQAQIKNAQLVGDSLKLITDLPEGYPEIVINKKTLMKINTNGTTITLTSLPGTDKLQGKSIGIVARYYLNTQTWKVAMVTFYSNDISPLPNRPRITPLPKLSSSSGNLKR